VTGGRATSGEEAELTDQERFDRRLFRPRRPEDFDALYAGTPPWDIGRPQPAFLALAEAGALKGRVLDVGCGTGEHALMAAELGLEATGVDVAA
jgi:2-polyprenyl-3-methyl-5-hydroxy-6-metoxy-1,4-benzoquinol methylase